MHFRGRLRDGGRERIALHAGLEDFSGRAKRKSKQCRDSTTVLRYVAHLSALELVREAIRLVPREARGLAPLVEMSIMLEAQRKGLVDEIDDRELLAWIDSTLLQYRGGDER